jgi:spermidine synthase
MSFSSTNPSTAVPDSRPFLPLLLVLFIGSGCAALIYEIVWLQLLQLVIGSTGVSLAVLLGTFMGGMCLGSLLLPRLISSRWHPLRVYAVLELGIGLIGIGVLFGMPYIEAIYTLHGGPGLALRGVVAAVCLLPPTLLMGATLPAIARWVETTPQGVSWLGFFYGANIGGAVLGCLLAGFYLLRVHDMPTATYVAVWINLSVVVIALGLSAPTSVISWLPAVAAAVYNCVVIGNACMAEDIRFISLGLGTAAIIAILIHLSWIFIAFVASMSLRTRAAQASSEPGALATGRGTVPVANAPGSDDAVLPARGAWAFYLTIALSGMAALGAEVIWTRLMSLMLGGTVYTFSIILAVFLVGLGIGSSVGAFLARQAVSARLALGVCQLLLTLAIGWTAWMICRSLPYWPINPSLARSPWDAFFLDMVRCLWAVLPPACLWGASFPLALAAVARRDQDPGRLVGGVYAANTLGAIVGALAFSMVIVPWVGTLGAQRLLIGISLLAGLIAIVTQLALALPDLLAELRKEAEGSTARLLRWIAGAASLPLVAIGAILLAASLIPIPWGTVAYGRYMATYDTLEPGIRDEADVPRESGKRRVYCTYVGEGMNVSVAVTKNTEGWRFFHGAGKVQASSAPQDMRLQRMLGHLPALLHKKPKTVLVVACGAGVTAGCFVLHPDVERIVICDIEPLVPKTVTPMFNEENYYIVDRIAKENPKTIKWPVSYTVPSGTRGSGQQVRKEQIIGKDKVVEVVYDDGRHFLRTTKEKFDIITSDPIDPWVKGCAALNTVEYYQMCKDHLNPGGSVSLWIPFYESNLDTAKSVIGTFFQVFPEGIVWSNDSSRDGYDAVLYGMPDQPPIDVLELHNRLNRPDHQRVKESLEKVDFGMGKMRFGGAWTWHDPEIDLLATFAGYGPQLEEWAADAQINRDRNLRLQYLAGMWLNKYEAREILTSIINYYSFPDKLFVGPPSRINDLKEALKEEGRKPPWE